MSVLQDYSSKTLKRTRRFVIDGVEVSVTTSKIIRDDEKKDEEMRFLRYVDDSLQNTHTVHTHTHTVHTLYTHAHTVHTLIYSPSR